MPNRQRALPGVAATQVHNSMQDGAPAIRKPNTMVVVMVMMPVVTSACMLHQTCFIRGTLARGKTFMALSSGERHSCVTRDDVTLTLCTLRATTVLSRNCCADFGRPFTQRGWCHIPLPKNSLPPTGMWNPSPSLQPPSTTPPTTLGPEKKKSK